MDYELFYNLKVRNPSMDFKSRFVQDFSSRHKQTYFEEYKQNLLLSVNNVAYRKQGVTEEPKKKSSPLKKTPMSFDHYQSLSHFKQKTSLSNSTSSSKISTPNCKSRSAASRTEDLTLLIPITTLSSAKRLTNPRELKMLSSAYTRQLKQFCTEVLSNLNQ